LAELQTDVQITLTGFFTLFAILISILLGFQQIYFSDQQILDRTYIAIFMLGSSVVMGWFLWQLLNRALTFRREIGELRKQYILVGEMPLYLKPDQEN